MDFVGLLHFSQGFGWFMYRYKYIFRIFGSLVGSIAYHNRGSLFPPWWLVRDFDAKSSGIFRQRKPHWSGCSGWKNRFVSPQPSHICQKCRGGIFQGWSVCFFVSNSNKINPWVTRKVLAYCISLHQSCQIILQSASLKFIPTESHTKWSCRQFLCPSMSNSAFFCFSPQVFGTFTCYPWLPKWLTPAWMLKSHGHLHLQHARGMDQHLELHFFLDEHPYLLPSGKLT